jgi:D-alanyl-D-alanine carboxypeptidase
MYHKELAKHISNRLKSGAGNEEIKTELQNDGWSASDIRDAFYYCMFPNKLEHFSLRRFFHSEMPTAIGALLLSIAIAGLTFSLIALTKETEVTEYSISLPSLPESDEIQFAYGEKPALSNPDFFNDVKEKFIESQAAFIEANLSEMIVRVWKNGTTTVEVPIRTKGREGSWWETPAGIYRVATKEDEHFSSLGHVFLPWSMAFQGNFFIHGWPYYPNGTPVSSKYSGGCIRLADEDAKKVYKEIQVGTPILVYESDFSSDNFVYSDDSESINATSYLSADLRNNQVFAQKDSQKIVPIASLTKLMTALVAAEYINLDSIATVNESSIASTSKPRLKAGMTLSVYQLLFPLLLESSNEAAEVIARSYGRKQFIDHMNEKAASIGMSHTTFADPSGSSSENVSTAEDLFLLSKYLYNNRNFILNITAGKLTSSAYGKAPFTDLENFNAFATDEYFVGGKIGKTTAARETQISIFELPVINGKRPIVFITLGSDDSIKNTSALMDYSLARFNRQTTIPPLKTVN